MLLLMKIANKPKHILLVVKIGHTQGNTLADEISKFLQGHGHKVSICNDVSTIDDYYKSDIDMGFVLGGDGTMLGVARAFVKSPIPLAAINLGRVGFLSELEVQDWQKGVKAITEGNCTIMPRMALGWNLYRAGSIINSGYAINDVVISRGALSRVISFDVSVDAEHISAVRADGIILSSPVGTTGYAVSAGGPLVHPANNVLLVTAICPYLCNFPAMVLPPSMPTRITLKQCSTETFATIDGQENYTLEAQDIVEVYCVPNAVYFARIDKDIYFTPLRKRGFIQ